MSGVMKTIALISTVFALPAASLLAQGQSDIDALRSRVDSAERRINLLERELSHLRGSTTAKTSPSHKAAAPAAGEYVVVKGDYLARIAKRNNVTVAALKQVNGLRSDNIRIGQKLRIPRSAQASASNAPRATVVKESAPASSASKHKVKRGETFYSIARQHNISTSALIAANPNVRPTSLRVGQTLSIQSYTAPASRRAVAKSQPKPKAKAASKDRPKPKASKSAVAGNTPKSSPPAKKSAEPAIRTITVHQQMTYGQFASKYGASTTQLNALNGLSLNKSTMLAKGSELYVPKY